jgi:hypothetical protein
MFICLWLVIQPNAVLLEYISPAKLRFHGAILSQKIVAVGYQHVSFVVIQTHLFVTF